MSASFYGELLQLPCYCNDLLSNVLFWKELDFFFFFFGYRSYNFMHSSFFFLFFFFCFWGPHSQHVEFPRLRVQSELQLPAYITATATPDPSWICDLHHSLWQCGILNPLSEARDQTFVLMDNIWVYHHESHHAPHFFLIELCLMDFEITDHNLFFFLFFF